MTKRNPSLTLAQDELGQISIFFSASLVVMITIVAFVINVGLFVKAKINLQNATDAAAFAGASVQARQLTKIAYLNWEMRNVYKEWLYKYYVVGNLNISDAANKGNIKRFTLEEDVNPIKNNRTKDPFNIPAVCIHISGSKTNICKNYSIPGLPEFGSTNLPGAEEASRAFMDTLIATKVDDCIHRTMLNMMVANTWTYNVLSNSSGDSLAGRGPAILSDRQGAWPKAVELALRIRNLEKMMNTPAETSGVCISGSTSLTRCSKSIDTVHGERKQGNERLVKAFYSGYRNLGNATDNEMKDTFTLTEIAPQKYKYENAANASNLLIPGDKIYEKQWVDLKLMMVNYAIFYAAMIPRAANDTSGACDVSKVAIPVPGYPMGFYKSPDFVTYYAVKGEAEFLGMFNPFESSVKLQAYAAAKPFGGRIGPMLFTQREGVEYMTARSAPNYRSVPYITSYDFKGVTVRNAAASGGTEIYNGSKFLPGIPLPTNSTSAPGAFWLEDPDKPIGGHIADAGAMQFGIPNLVYDYENPFRKDGYTTQQAKIYKILAANEGAEEPVGLFSTYQFNKFKGTALTANVTVETLDHEIARVRAPTSYEAANYLIPSPHDFNESNHLDSFGFINSPGDAEKLSNGTHRYQAQVYAPLYRTDQPELLYTNKDDVKRAIFDFMRIQKAGMDKYKQAMNVAAKSIWDQQMTASNSAVGANKGYEKAARGVSDIPDAVFRGTDEDAVRAANPQTCDSLAGQFLYFYYKDVQDDLVPANQGSTCPKPLKELFDEYFAGAGGAMDGFNPSYYDFRFSWPEANKEENLKLFSGYMPGTATGAQENGDWVNPVAPYRDVMRRNFYSTKFITLKSVIQAGSENYGNDGFMIYTEGNPLTTTDDTKQNKFLNPINTSDAPGDVSAIKY